MALKNHINFKTEMNVKSKFFISQDQYSWRR